MENLILIGAGGYAKSVLDSIDIYNYTMCGFIDEFNQASEHLGYPILGRSLDDINDNQKYVYFVTIGNNTNRNVWYTRLISHHLRIINVIDKSAIVSPRAHIGNGCFVGKMAVINSCAVIGNNCIINTRALVEHGCTVSDHVNLSTNSVLNGDVKIGTGSFIGSCSVIIGQRSIGSWSTIGAGGVVIENVGDNVTAVGVPTRIIKTGAMLG